MKFPVLSVCLFRVGVLPPPRVIHYLNGLLNYLNLGRWFHDRKLLVPVRCASGGCRGRWNYGGMEDAALDGKAAAEKISAR